MPDILLVEDKDSLRRVLRMTLEGAGYSVTEAADARIAANEIARTPHRVVLTDLRMPYGSGLDVLKAAKAVDSDIPVILMTAFGSIDEAVQAMKDGAHDFLQNVDQLPLLLVERALEQARLRTENVLLREEWSSGMASSDYRRVGDSETSRRRSPASPKLRPMLLLGNRAPARAFCACRPPSVASSRKAFRRRQLCRYSGKSDRERTVRP